MIVLFIYAQVQLFSSEVSSCQKAAVDRNTGYVRQYDATLSFVVVQYLKLFILIASIIFFRCCL